MQLEVGAVVDGVISGLTNFGAFVNLPEGKSGMVHISEVSSSFVKDINEFLTVGQSVKVKIISVADDGKIGLSIRKAEETEQPRPQAPRKPRGERKPNVWQGQQTPPPSNSFEDMMARFKQESDEKMSAFKKANDTRRGGRGGRGGRG